MEKNIGTPARTIEIMKEYDISPNKALGQNFLIDNNILDKIVAAGEVTQRDHVIEIGPGLGSLSQKVAEAAGKVTLIEKDKKLIPVLKETLGKYTNVSYIEGDVLKVDWSEILTEDLTCKVIANLPYYITTPIIMGLLEERVPVELMIFMVQKEVAERMIAPPGGKDYGVLSIAVQYYAEPEIVFSVPPTVFIPQPNVYSAVIKLTRRKRPPVEVENEGLFFRVVRSAFQQRRKTLRNSLANSPELPLSKDEIVIALEAAEIDPRLRGEKLDLSDFGRMTQEIQRLIDHK